MRQVVDFNITHALISISFRKSSSFDEMDEESAEDENITWATLSQMGLINTFENVDLTTSYESTFNIAGFGVRNCMIYEYALPDGNLTITVYVDKSIGWPLKITISINENALGLGLDLDIKLAKTNTPAL